MSANKEARIEVSGVIKEKIQDAKSVVFVKFNGLTVAEDTELRREFRKNNVEYKVYKNTLIRKAFESMGITDFNDDLNGPTAVAFGTDETAAAKVACDMCKKTNDKISVKSGYVVLCSDGLTNHVSDGDIYETVMNADLSLEEKTSALISAANAGGGLDNITAVLAELN